MALSEGADIGTARARTGSGGVQPTQRMPLQAGREERGFLLVVRDADRRALRTEHFEWNALASEIVPELLGWPSAHTVRELALPGAQLFDAQLPHHQDVGSARRSEQIGDGVEHQKMLLGDLFDIVLHHRRTPDDFD